MTDQKSAAEGAHLTVEQQQARRSRACAMGIALSLFALMIYLATLARLAGVE